MGCSDSLGDLGEVDERLANRIVVARQTTAFHVRGGGGEQVESELQRLGRQGVRQGPERPPIALGLCVLQLVYALGETYREVVDEIDYLGIFRTARTDGIAQISGSGKRIGLVPLELNADSTFTAARLIREMPSRESPGPGRIVVAGPPPRPTGDQPGG